MSSAPAMHLIETDETMFAERLLPQTCTVAAWNLERCLDPEGSAALLRQYEPDIILLSEMDCGMARTAQRNTTRNLASLLECGYAYALEFHEMGLGSALEAQLATNDFNALGWHGNAILTKAKPIALALIRLDDHGHWFCANDGVDPGQPRIGGRVAVAAILPTQSGHVCAVSTHLESAGSISIRQSQMDRIISAVDHFAPDMPVIVGGDLNTGNNLDNPEDWSQETLFEAAKRQGFSWEANAPGTTTRASRLTRFPERAMKLDWFANRDCVGHSAKTIPALDAQGTPLSDHELIVAKFDC